MTREEAIKELSYIADEMPSMECADWKEAISMAIEALQQEPTYTSEIAQKAYEDGKKDGYIQRKIEKITENDLEVDCVSRQAVDNLVWEYLRKATDENIAFYEKFLDLPSVTPREKKKRTLDRTST